ncbi:Predicted permease YjgP/YjgQ family [hydrothermal vent metagenome]|uniref:Predicted permease YjgP/YjgQ family n=1 Tax=hydrothermal vent metagenome TaxID=652676 RepID=A0A1W1EIA3_9ZZZZ
MGKIRWYILSNFFKTFLSLFIPLFLIISLVYVVKIATLTTEIEISFSELIEIFSYFIPIILFYTMPISFMASVSSMFFRLSSDNELVALFSLGIRSSYIIKIIAYLATLLSIFLLFLSIFIVPQSKSMFASFKETKLSQARVNIVPNQLGQKFGNFYIYIKSKENKLLTDVVIFNASKQGEQIFIAPKGEIRDNNGLFSLLLNSGRGYTYNDNRLKEIDYESMEIFDYINYKNISFSNALDYWSQAQHSNNIRGRLLFFIFTSLMPILSLYIIVSFSIINSRYQKNRLFLVIFSVSIIYYLTAILIKQNANETLFILSILISIILSFYLFRRKIASFY